MKKHLVSSLLVACTILPAFALAPTSGLKSGETVSAFHPTHVTGPLKGSDSCPPCTYGVLPQVQVWVNGDNAENIAAIAKTLNDAVAANKSKKLQAFFIVLTDKANQAKTAELIKSVNAKAGSDNVHMAWLLKDDKAISDYKVNTGADVKNTIMLYKNRKVTDNMVNLKADKSGLGSLQAAIGKITA